MKKSTRRDGKAVRVRPVVPLDRAVLEHITAGHKTVDPVAGSLLALTTDGRFRDR